MTDTTARAALLVDTQWVADHLEDPNLRIVDIRGAIKPPSEPKPWYRAKHEAYRESHIPGAHFVDWTDDIVEPAAPIHMTLAGPERFRTLMEQLGIGDDSEVVVYDDSGSLAPRLWWALNYYGHPRVRVLDGGWSKWIAEGRPVTAATPPSKPARFTPRVQAAWRAGTAEVRANLKEARAALVDCRTPEEWRGEIGRGERKGRIPGSVNVPSVHSLQGPHRTWKDAAALRELYTAAGVTPERPVITYCNAGVSAAVGLFALRLAGFPAVANYSGSWYEWESDPANPIETGSGPV